MSATPPPQLSTREPLMRKLIDTLVHQPGASMEQLAQEAGISRATLHRYVSSREELIRVLNDYARCTCRRTFESLRLEEGPGDQAVQRLVAALSPHANLYLLLTRATTDCHLEPDDSVWRDRLTTVFQRGQEDGLFRVDVSAQWMVEALGALLHASAEAAQAGRLARADMDSFVLKVLLEGVRRPAPAA